MPVSSVALSPILQTALTRAGERNNVDFSYLLQTAIRESRAAGFKAAQALAQSYTALVSGVLMGMSDALRSGGQEAAAPATPKAAGKARK